MIKKRKTIKKSIKVNNNLGVKSKKKVLKPSRSASNKSKASKIAKLKKLAALRNKNSKTKKGFFSKLFKK